MYISPMFNILSYQKPGTVSSWEEVGPPLALRLSWSQGEFPRTSTNMRYGGWGWCEQRGWVWGRTASFLLSRFISLCFSFPIFSAVLLVCIYTLMRQCIANWEGVSHFTEKTLHSINLTECLPRARHLDKFRGVTGSLVLTMEFNLYPGGYEPE